MALGHWVFLYTAPGLEPEGRVTVVDSPRCRTVLVGVPDVASGVRYARTLGSEVQLVELCGGFGPRGTAQVLEALGGRIPVGSVGYGPESVDGVQAIFS